MLYDTWLAIHFIFNWVILLSGSSAIMLFALAHFLDVNRKAIPLYLSILAAVMFFIFGAMLLLAGGLGLVHSNPIY